MRYTLLLFISSVIFSCNSQLEKKITTELDYFPEQRTDVTDEKYRKWINSLKNTYEYIKADSGQLVYADHLNIATAFIKLKEPKQKVLDQFYLAQRKDLESTAEIFPMIYRSFKSVEGYLSEAEYDSLLAKFEKVMANKVEEVIDPVGYAEEGGYNTELVKLMASLAEKDQEYRMSDMYKQQLIDQENIQTIDSLFEKHQSYIGRTLVGEKYKSTMWLVIQHSDLEHQEMYLPIVHQSVKDGELPPTALKMLIDRVYKKKYGYQIFGSQSGGELATDDIIEKVKSEYGL